MEKRRVRLRTWHWLVIVLAVIVSTWVGLRLHWKAQFRREVAAIKASGWPVTMEEVDRSYTIPEGMQNAADIYLEALAKMVGGSADLPMVGTANLPGRHEHLDPNTAKAVAEYLEENKECLDLLHKAVDVEHCRYPLDLGADLRPLWDYLRDARRAAFMLRLDAYWHADRGEAEAAAQTIESLMALASSLEAIPSVSAFTVGVACRSLALIALEDSLGRTAPSDAQLERVYRRLAKVQIGASGHLARALAGQRVGLVLQLTGPNAMRYEDCYPKWNPDLVAPYVFFGLADKDAAKALEVYRRLIELADCPPERRLPTFHIALPRVSQFWGVASSVNGTLPRNLSLHTKSLAHVEAAKVGLVIERFRLANGRLPEDLAALVPTYLDAIPNDPFDGKPLRYLKQDIGFVVYSIGGDLTDDQGTPLRRVNNLGDVTGDITFTVER